MKKISKDSLPRYTVSESARKQRADAPKSHGIYSFAARGEDSLSPEKVSQLAQLRRLVKSHPGRMHLREELAARCALIVDLAMAELISTHEQGRSIWSSPVIARMGTFMAELRRVLDTFPTESHDDDFELNRIKQVIEAEEDE